MLNMLDMCDMFGMFNMLDMYDSHPDTRLHAVEQSVIPEDYHWVTSEEATSDDIIVMLIGPPESGHHKCGSAMSRVVNSNPFPRYFFANGHLRWAFERTKDRNQDESLQQIAAAWAGCRDGFTLRFAYGQTGAGKTHTMWPLDVRDVALDLPVWTRVRC